MEIIYVLISGTISSILFSILFKGLNNSMLKVFVPLQKLTRKLKRKRIYDAITLLCLIFIATEIKDMYSLNIICFGIVLGFAFSLNDIIFEGGISSWSKYRNKED
jgi:hypothetical protein